jgi:hypothetical protein
MRKCVVLLLLLVACSLREPAEGVASQAVCLPDDPGPNCCPTCCESPIVIDVAGDGLRLTSAADGVSFSLSPGPAHQWSWTSAGSDDAWLVLPDLNGDSEVTDGTEMFGNLSLQESSTTPNGFRALAWYDNSSRGGNGDGKFDASDAVWSRLRLWRDADHDGWSAPSELSPLDAAVLSFNLAFKASTEVDANGNPLRYRSTLVPAPGSSTSIDVTDVWLRSTPSSTGPSACITEYRCTAWAYAVTTDGGALCNHHRVLGDPVVDVPWPGSRSRLVVRSLISQDMLSVRTGAQQAVHNDVIGTTAPGAVPLCRDSVHPVPDFEPPLYTPGVHGYRMKCRARENCGGCGG